MHIIEWFVFWCHWCKEAYKTIVKTAKTKRKNNKRWKKQAPIVTRSWVEVPKHQYLFQLNYSCYQRRKEQKTKVHYRWKAFELQVRREWVQYLHIIMENILPLMHSKGVNLTLFPFFFSKLRLRFVLWQGQRQPHHGCNTRLHMWVMLLNYRPYWVALARYKLSNLNAQI